jgi:hypothetical protein
MMLLGLALQMKLALTMVALLLCIGTVSRYVPVPYPVAQRHLKFLPVTLILLSLFTFLCIGHLAKAFLSFLRELTNLFEIISLYGSEIILSGDFNIHTDDLTNANVRRFLELLDVFGFQQYVNAPTHVCGHILDLVITRPTLVPCSISVDPPALSNHGLVTYCLKFTRPAPAVMTIKVVRRVRNINKNAFAFAMQQSSICADIVNLDNFSVSALCDSYQSELRRIVDAMAPSVSIVISRRPSAPWYDSECRVCMLQEGTSTGGSRSRLHTDYLAWLTALQEKKVLFASEEQNYWTTTLLRCAGDSKLL